jgi:hypothetical protein
LGDAPGVGAVVVVEVEVGVEFALQAAVAQVDEAREGGAPALFEDRAVQAFDVPVGLRAPGADATVAGAEVVQTGAEVEVAELVAVVRG